MTYERVFAAASVVAVIIIIGFCLSMLLSMLFDFRTPEEKLQDVLKAEKSAEQTRTGR